MHGTPILAPKLLIGQTGKSLSPMLVHPDVWRPGGLAVIGIAFTLLSPTGNNVELVISSFRGPRKLTFSAAPRCTTSGDSVLTSGKSPSRKRYRPPGL